MSIWWSWSPVRSHPHRTSLNNLPHPHSGPVPRLLLSILQKRLLPVEMGPIVLFLCVPILIRVLIFLTARGFHFLLLLSCPAFHQHHLLSSTAMSPPNIPMTFHLVHLQVNPNIMKRLLLLWVFLLELLPSLLLLVHLRLPIRQNAHQTYRLVRLVVPIVGWFLAKFIMTPALGLKPAQRDMLSLAAKPLLSFTRTPIDISRSATPTHTPEELLFLESSLLYVCCRFEVNWDFSCV